jgi:hypothetical protein
MGRFTRNIHLDIPIQKVIRLKQTLRDDMERFFEFIGGAHHIHDYLDNGIEDFVSVWNRLIISVNDILDFCDSHGIILDYNSQHTSVTDWLRQRSKVRGDQVTLSIFRKYLDSNFVTSLPEDIARDFANSHRFVILKIGQLEKIAKEHPRF